MDVDYQVITSKKKYFLLLPDNSDSKLVEVVIVVYLYLHYNLSGIYKRLGYG
jgi:hypothetical protein